MPFSEIPSQLKHLHPRKRRRIWKRHTLLQKNKQSNIN